MSERWIYYHDETAQQAQVEYGRSVVAVPPAALQVTFGDRVRDAITDKQLVRHKHHLHSRGVFDFLRTVDSRPWDAYMEVMSGIEEARSEPVSAGPGYETRTSITFTDNAAAGLYHELSARSYAGIWGKSLPLFKTSGPTLEIMGFRHPDLVQMGLLGRLAMEQQYEGTTEAIMRLVTAQKIGEIGNVVLDHLPLQMATEIASYIDQKYARMGKPEANRTLLTSGNLSIVGSAVRGALQEFTQPNGKNPALRVLRPTGNRPFVFEGVHLIGMNDGGIPMATGTISESFKGAVSDRWEKLRDPYTKRDVPAALKELWGLVSELGASEGFSIARAVGVVASGAYTAADRLIQDRLRLRPAEGPRSTFKQ